MTFIMRSKKTAIANKSMSRAFASALAVSASFAVLDTIPGFSLVSEVSAAVVRSISVRGNERVSAETVRQLTEINVGSDVSAGDIDRAVKSLFGSGLFADVSVSRSGSTLVVSVEEFSVVNQVIFQGNRKVKDATLASRVQLQPRSAFSSELMDQDIEAIRASYAAVGRDNVEITSQTIDLGDGRLNVVYDINEGDRTKISNVTFVGNNAFSDGRLRQTISTKRSNFLSGIYRNDIYSEDRLRADEEALRQYYFNRGYADFQIISSTADLDPTENEYLITFTVDEGERYKFGDIVIESTVDGIDAADLYSQVKTPSGKVYSGKKVEDTLIALTERVAGEGFAFADVTPRGDRDFENRTISITYTIDQGQRAYIERIEIRGNDRTRDYVIRREFDISEGDAFNQVLVRKAKQRLDALGYFQSVNVSTVPGSEPDKVVLVIDVIDQSTGEFSIGAGYSVGGDGDGITLEASVTERNFLGRGQFLRIAVGGGADDRTFNLAFTEPYFMGSRISTGFEVFRNTSTSDNTYDLEQTGGSIRFGLPITDALTANASYNLSSTKYTQNCATTIPNPNPNGLNAFSCLPDDIENYVNGVNSSGTWIKSSVSASLTYNTLDSTKLPRSGIFANVNVEVAGAGGDASFVKSTGKFNTYYTVAEELDLVAGLTLGAGHISSIGSNGIGPLEYFRLNNKFIRGFDSNGIGPVDSTGRQIGGETYFNASAEAHMPVPAIPESLGLRFSVFADAATLYGYSGNLVNGPAQGTDMEWRASVGAGIMWDSPFGPLRFDYAVPINEQPTDDIENISFGVATRF